MLIQLHRFHSPREDLMSENMAQSGLLCPGAVVLENIQGNSRRTQGEAMNFHYFPHNPTNSEPNHEYAGGHTHEGRMLSPIRLQFGPGAQNHPCLMS